MTLISQTIRSINAKCALIPFITAGYPSLESTVEALYILDRKGADVIELGIPYSDALADGPIIQESSRVALQQGVYVDQVFSIVEEVSSKLNAPIVIFTYYNPVLAKGAVCFVENLFKCGARGLIIPDLPLEEADYMINLCKQFNIELILFIAPTSSDLRIASIASKAPGCIYLVSSNGVTGFRDKIEQKIDKLAKMIKEKTSKLIILGFGISDTNQVANISSWHIDGIVIGSAFVRRMSYSYGKQGLMDFSLFCSQVREVIDT